MRALTIDSFAKIPEGLNLRDDWPEPSKAELKPTELFVKVAASSINPVDWKIAEGMLKPITTIPLPKVISFDLSGTVEAVGSAVTRFKKGDAIIVRLPTTDGSCQEYVAVEEKYVSKMPSNLSFEEAAGIPLAAQTALQSFDDAGLDPNADNSGKKAFVPAGLGGVGLFATQILKNVYGFQVATTVSTNKVEKMKELVPGIEVVDYKTTDYTTKLSDVDYVLDTTGDLANEAKIVRKGAVVNSIAAMPDPDVISKRLGPPPFYIRPVLRCLSWWQSRPLRSAGATYSYVWMEPDHKCLDKISKWIEDGKVKVVVDSVHPWKDAKEAFVRSKQSITGKVIIKVEN
uniref:ARAD1C03014p n=1 Tax=Blastobotrys adeninivorans TaxID=409370 RepID=A0A060T4A5_BLAAD